MHEDLLFLSVSFCFFAGVVLFLSLYPLGPAGALLSEGQTPERPSAAGLAAMEPPAHAELDRAGSRWITLCALDSGHLWTQGPILS